MKLKCPDSECNSKKSSPTSKLVIRKGRFYRQSDGQWIPRYRQKKRKLNFQIELLLNSTVSQRRAAKILGVNRKTVIKKFQVGLSPWNLGRFNTSSLMILKPVSIRSVNL